MIRRAAMPSQGLYAITALDPEHLEERLAQAILGGAKIVQYRAKDLDFKRRLTMAQAIKIRCQAASIPLIINDDVTLAVACGADGVHLGKEDLNYARARRALGNQAIIGISCYGQLRCALQAAMLGADYVALGCFFPSTTKPHAAPCPIQILRAVRRQVSIPIIAIGGITPDNAAKLIHAGADLIAVSASIFAPGVDTNSACARLSNLFSPKNLICD